MNWIRILLKASLKGVQNCQIIRGVAAPLGAVQANLNVELLADVTLGLSIKGREIPRTNPVKPHGKVPPHTMALRRVVVGSDKCRPCISIIRLRKSNCLCECFPEGVNVICLAFVVEPEKP